MSSGARRSSRQSSVQSDSIGSIPALSGSELSTGSRGSSGSTTSGANRPKSERSGLLKEALLNRARKPESGKAFSEAERFGFGPKSNTTVIVSDIDSPVDEDCAEVDGGAPSDVTVTGNKSAKSSKGPVSSATRNRGGRPVSGTRKADGRGSGFVGFGSEAKPSSGTKNHHKGVAPSSENNSPDKGIDKVDSDVNEAPSRQRGRRGAFTNDIDEPRSSRASRGGDVPASSGREGRKDLHRSEHGEDDAPDTTRPSSGAARPSSSVRGAKKAGSGVQSEKDEGAEAVPRSSRSRRVSPSVLSEVVIPVSDNESEKEDEGGENSDEEYHPRSERPTSPHKLVIEDTDEDEDGDEVRSDTPKVDSVINGDDKEDTPDERKGDGGCSSHSSEPRRESRRIEDPQLEDNTKSDHLSESSGSDATQQKAASQRAESNAGGESVVQEQGEALGHGKSAKISQKHEPTEEEEGDKGQAKAESGVEEDTDQVVNTDVGERSPHGKSKLNRRVAFADDETIGDSPRHGGVSPTHVRAPEATPPNATEEEQSAASDPSNPPASQLTFADFNSFLKEPKEAVPDIYVGNVYKNVSEGICARAGACLAYCKDSKRTTPSYGFLKKMKREPWCNFIMDLVTQEEIEVKINGIPKTIIAVNFPACSTYQFFKSLDGYDQNNVRYFALCALQAIRFVHDKGLILRNITESSFQFCFIEGKEGFKLTEFWDACEYEVNPRRSSFTENKQFMSPKHPILKTKADDYWNLGIIITELFTGYRLMKASDFPRVERKGITGVERIRHTLEGMSLKDWLGKHVSPKLESRVIRAHIHGSARRFVERLFKAGMEIEFDKTVASICHATFLEGGEGAQDTKAKKSRPVLMISCLGKDYIGNTCEVLQGYERIDGGCMAPYKRAIANSSADKQHNNALQQYINFFAYFASDNRYAGVRTRR